MHLSLLGFELITRRAPLRPLTPSRGGWAPLVREPYTGAWQRNDETYAQTPLGNPTVFACVTLIARDVAKLNLRLVEQDDEGIWHETTNPAWSPVLRKPNRYQTILTFIEQWMTSKLVHGNTYALKERDGRGLVRAMYVLDPKRVTPLVAPDGSVYYELRRDDLAGLVAGAFSGETLTVPASEIFHDKCVPLFHPLIGTSPLFACAVTALQGLTIQDTSTKFFARGSHPGGVLLAPGEISDATAQRLKDYWETNFTGANVGRVAVLGDNLKYEAMTVNATDAQLLEQLNWTAETICSCFHVPAFMVGIGNTPPVSSVEPMLQQYYSQCLQSYLTAAEQVLDEGLGLEGTVYGTEFDIDDLIWMDTATRTKAAADAIGSGAMSPNEARRKWFGLGSVAGGQTPYMQQQNYSLAALDARDRDDPFAKPEPAPAAPPPPAPEEPETPPAPTEEPVEPVEGEKAVRLGVVALALLRKDWSRICDAEP